MIKIGLATIWIFCVLITNQAVAYEYCITKVKEIQPHISSGTVFFKFDDGTAIEANDSNSGLQRNLAIALAAQMAGKEVKVALNDGFICGANNRTNWSYIMSISN